MEDIEEIRITQNGKVKNYINYALKRLTGCIDGDNMIIDSNNNDAIDTICFYGTGRAAAKVITSTEVLKSLVPGLHQITELSSIPSDERNKFMKLDTNQVLMKNDGLYELYEEEDEDDENDNDNDNGDDDDDIDNDNNDDNDKTPGNNNNDSEDPQLVLSRHRSWKTITVLRIILSKNQLDTKHIGYQSPNNNNEEFQELINSAKTSVFVDKNKISKQIKKKKGNMSPVAINVIETLNT